MSGRFRPPPFAAQDSTKLKETDNEQSERLKVE